MTNEEAIMILKAMIDEMILVFDRDRKKALNMAIEALKAQDVPDTNDGDMISRKLMHDLGATCIARRDDDGELIALGRIDMLPSVKSKQLQVLADVLDGCPLTQPCDKMWRGGWCEEHCKNNKLQEPNAECWLKYAEVMASEQ